MSELGRQLLVWGSLHPRTSTHMHMLALGPGILLRRKCNCQSQACKGMGAWGPRDEAECHELFFFTSNGKPPWMMF